MTFADHDHCHPFHAQVLSQRAESSLARLHDPSLVLVLHCRCSQRQTGWSESVIHLRYPQHPARRDGSASELAETDVNQWAVKAIQIDSLISRSYDLHPVHHPLLRNLPYLPCSGSKREDTYQKPKLSCASASDACTSCTIHQKSQLRRQQRLHQHQFLLWRL